MTGHHLRLVGAAAILTGGAVHLQLAFDRYGTTRLADSFVVNAALSAVVAGWLALRSDRLGALAGVLLSVGSLAALVASRVGDGLFDFRGTGFEPAPQTPLAVAAEVVAIAALAASVVLGRRALVDPAAVDVGEATSPRRRRSEPLRVVRSADGP